MLALLFQGQLVKFRTDPLFKLFERMNVMAKYASYFGAIEVAFV